MLSKLKKLLKIKKGRVSKQTKKSAVKRAGTKYSSVKKLKTKIVKKKSAAKPKGKSIPREELVGIITHYFPHVKAGVIKIKKGSISVSDSLHIKGHTTDFIQKVNSLQIDQKPIQSATKGKEIGLLVKSRVRHNDKVYRLK